MISQDKDKYDIIRDWVFLIGLCAGSAIFAVAFTYKFQPNRKEKTMFYRVTIKIESYDDSNPDVGPSIIGRETRYEQSYNAHEEAIKFSDLLEAAAQKIAAGQDNGEPPADQDQADQGGEPAADQGGEPGKVSKSESTDPPKGETGKVSKSESVEPPKGGSGIS